MPDTELTVTVKHRRLNVCDITGWELNPNTAGLINYGNGSTYFSRQDGSAWVRQPGIWIRYDIRAIGGVSVYLNPIDIPPITPQPENDEFSINGPIDTSGNRFAGSIPWTAQNLSTVQVGDVLDEALDAKYTGGAGTVIRGWTQPLAAGTFLYRLRTVNITRDAPTAGDFYIGFMLRESATGKILTFSLGRNAVDTSNSIYVRRWTSFSAMASSTSFGNPINNNVDNKYLAVERDGSGVLKFYFSSEGRVFVISGSEAQTVAFTTAPDQIGIFMVAGSTGSHGLFGWFRRYA